MGRGRGRPITDLVSWPLPRLAEWLEELGPEAAPAEILEPILLELQRRVALLLEVGLDYLALDRLTRSLSGGEAQRIGIANALGSPLTDGVYVLDEPSVGLHARDTGRIVALLRELAERGNTVLVVEHDLDVIRAADHVVELGPGSGAEGGRLVFTGTPDELASAATRTGAWLRGEATLPERRRREPTGPWLASAPRHKPAGRDVEIRCARGRGERGGIREASSPRRAQRGLRRAQGDGARGHLGEQGGEPTRHGVEWLARLAWRSVADRRTSARIQGLRQGVRSTQDFADTPAARRAAAAGNSPQ